jgi:hypothetical protein
MHKHILRFLLVALLAFPLPAYGGGTIEAENTVAGLETQAVLGGFRSSSSVELHVVNPTDEDVILPVRMDSTGNAAVVIPGELVQMAGTYALYAEAQGTKLTSNVSFEVLPDRVDSELSTLTTDTDELSPNGSDEAVVTVTLLDKFGNPLKGRPVELIGSRASDSIAALSKETNAQGQQRFSVRAKSEGQIILRALDLLSSTQLKGSLHISAEAGVGGAVSPSTRVYTAQVAGSSNAGAASSFRISVEPATPKTKETVDLVVTAVDAQGNVVVDYTGNPEILTPDDPDAVLPGLESGGQGTLTFTAKNQGSKRFPLSIEFSTPGDQLMIVRDASRGIEGRTTVTVTGGMSSTPSGQGIEILSPKQDGKVTGDRVMVEGIAKKLMNLKISGGVKTVSTETDDKGMFSVSIDLAKGLNEYTLTVESEKGERATLHLVRDSEGPTIQNVTFSPHEPMEGENTLVTVVSEQSLKEVSMRLEDTSLRLMEDRTHPGTYTVNILAPKSGTYQPDFVAVDAAGNATETRSTLTVAMRALGIVQNVKAEGKATSIMLTWDPLENEKVASYIVEVTDSHGDVTTLETDGPRAAATVKGLKPGAEYSFTVQAKEGKHLSEQKSEIVKASTLGLNLIVTPLPERSSLQLDWSYTDASVPLQGFLLEYGDSKNSYTEKRVLHAEARTYILGDLLSGIPYELRITPIDITGNYLTDLTQTATAPALVSSGFVPGSEDPVTLPQGDDHPLQYHSGAPTTSQSGFTTSLLWITGTAALAFAIIQRRRKAKKRTQDFLSMMHNQYSGNHSVSFSDHC